MLERGKSLAKNWYSPSQTGLGNPEQISTLEDLFEIVMEMDDIIDFSSYQKGLELLEKYGIVF